MAAPALSGDLAADTLATTHAPQCKENAVTKERAWTPAGLELDGARPVFEEVMARRRRMADAVIYENRAALSTTDASHGVARHSIPCANFPLVPTSPPEEMVKGESLCGIEADVENETAGAEVENSSEVQIFKLSGSTSAFESGWSGLWDGPEDDDIGQQMFYQIIAWNSKRSGGRGSIFLVPLVRQALKRRREFRSAPCEKEPGRMRCIVAKGVSAGRRQSNRLMTFFQKERQSSNQEIDAVLAPFSEAQLKADDATVQELREAQHQNVSLLESRLEIGEIAKPVTESQCEVVATVLRGTTDTQQPPPSSPDVDEAPKKVPGARFSAIAAALQESKTLIALEPNLAKPSLAEDASTFGDGEASATIPKTQFAAVGAALEDSKHLIIVAQAAHRPATPESRRVSNLGVRVPPPVLKEVKRWITLAQRAKQRFQRKPRNTLASM